MRYAKLYPIVYDLGVEYSWAYVLIEDESYGKAVISNNLVEHVNMDDKRP